MSVYKIPGIYNGETLYNGKTAYNAPSVYNQDRMDYELIGDRKYPVVKMPDGKIWMAENLDYKFLGLAVGQPSLSSINPYANYYDQDEAEYGFNGKKCGLLYNWPAVKYLNDYKNSLIPNWHVPSLSEWNTLISAISSDTDKLKSKDMYWFSNWNGVDTYKFKILPAGGNVNPFVLIGTKSFFWTITPVTSLKSYRVDFDSSSSVTINPSGQLKDYEFSLRLVKD